MFATVAARAVFATVEQAASFAAVMSPRQAYAEVTAPAIAADKNGRLYDQESGQFLFDDVTGLALTW